MIFKQLGPEDSESNFRERSSHKEVFVPNMMERTVCWTCKDTEQLPVLRMFRSLAAVPMTVQVSSTAVTALALGLSLCEAIGLFLALCLNIQII